MRSFMEKTSIIPETMRKIENLTIIRAIRDGLINIIPVFTIGAFALVFQTFPVDAYQKAISTFLGGFFLKFFEVIYNATFGVMSVYLTFSISRSYMKLRSNGNVATRGATVTSLLSFFILAGAYLPDFGIDYMGPKSMFLALLTSIGASSAYLFFYRLLQKQRNGKIIISGDREFNKMISTVLPILFVTLAFALLNILIMFIFGVDSCRTLISNIFNRLFSFGKSGFFKGFLFVLFSSLLWLFGIHGSDTLEDVMQTYFAPGLQINQAAVAAGGAPTEILTKGFFDFFVLIGGCGATICLLIAILIASRNRSRKLLGLTAALPMIFNINELMVFGLPIIFNPVMLIPFLLVPLVNFTISYAAIALGIVPMITADVAWTTPIIFGGLNATGSVAGAILQVFNIITGVLIYIPFVKMLDRQTEQNEKDSFDSFTAFFKENEQSLSGTRLVGLRNSYGDFAKDLCNDIKYGIRKQITLAYQPQHKYSGECVGVEALLRYEHPVFGMIYPPLVIKLAEDGGFLAELEEKILLKALNDRPRVLEQFGENVKLSVNVLGTTVVTPRYIQFCRNLNARDPFAGKNICIEITEQAAISFNEETLSALDALHKMGIHLAIDDFSMGQTSIHYLRYNMFDLIKLDGSLVDGLFKQDTTSDIISSIVQLAKTLDVDVLAEYVDTNEKREALHELGCDLYQGYLYSPAVFLKGKQ